MKTKIITFLIASLLYGLFMYAILYFVENDFDSQSKLFQSIFFGFGMGLFEVLIRPYIQKMNNRI